MKDLKLWQKMGLVAAIVGGLTLGGLTPKYNSKGLESKIPTVGVNVAEAKEVNPQGYEVPNLTGYTKIGDAYIDTDEDGVKETFYEVFKKDGEGYIMKLMTSKGTWGWAKMKSEKDPNRYTIVDSDGKKYSNGNQTFEEKYLAGDLFSVPEWAK